MDYTEHKQQPEHLQMGQWGEQLAAAYLQRKGYVILERDWHSNHRDIDIIAQQDDELVFVEVKTRRNSQYTTPLAAMNYQKLKNLRMAINHYIKFHHFDGSWRFDVITIVGTPGCEQPEVEHIEDFSLV